MSPPKKISKLQVSLSRPDLTKRDLGEKRALRLSTRGKKNLLEPRSSRKAVNNDVRSRKRRVDEGIKLARSWV